MIKKLLLGTIFATTSISGFTLEFKHGPMPAIQVIGVTSEEDLETARKNDVLRKTSKQTLCFIRNKILAPIMIITGLYLLSQGEKPYDEYLIDATKENTSALISFIATCISYPSIYAIEALIDSFTHYRVKNTLQKSSFYTQIAYGHIEYVNDAPNDLTHLVIYDNDGAYLGDIAVDSNSNTYAIVVNKDKQLTICSE